jgi:feruloyl-CoA synthase
MNEFRAAGRVAKSATGARTGYPRDPLAEAASLDAGEMTDKGSINQRAVLSRRIGLVEELYATQPSPRVLAIDKGK